MKVNVGEKVSCLETLHRSLIVSMLYFFAKSLSIASVYVLLKPSASNTVK